MIAVLWTYEAWYFVTYAAGEIKDPQRNIPRAVLGARKLSRLQSGKLSIKVTCPESCRVKARLISGRTVVASRSRTRLGAGTVIVRPKTSKAGRKLLKRRSTVGMTLAVDVTDDQGRTTTLARVLRFRR